MGKAPPRLPGRRLATVHCPPGPICQRIPPVHRRRRPQAGPGRSHGLLRLRSCSQSVQPRKTPFWAQRCPCHPPQRAHRHRATPSPMAHMSQFDGPRGVPAGRQLAACPRQAGFVVMKTAPIADHAAPAPGPRVTLGGRDNRLDPVGNLTISVSALDRECHAPADQHSPRRAARFRPLGGRMVC